MTFVVVTDKSDHKNYVLCYTCYAQTQTRTGRVAYHYVCGLTGGGKCFLCGRNHVQ